VQYYKQDMFCSMRMKELDLCSPAFRLTAWLRWKQRASCTRRRSEASIRQLSTLSGDLRLLKVSEVHLRDCSGKLLGTHTQHMKSGNSGF